MSLIVRSKLMLIVAVVFFIYSMLWALAPYPSINLPARFILDVSDWPLDNISTPLDRNTQWLSSIAAGVLAALSVFLGGVVVPAIRSRNTSVIRTTIAAILAWYVIDSVGSVASGVSSNVFFNTIYLVLILIPLLGCGDNKPLQKKNCE